MIKRLVVLLLISLCAMANAKPPQSAQLVFRQPLDSPAGKYSHALLSEAYRRLGVDIEFIEMPLGRSLIEANRGTLDGELARVLRTTEHYPSLNAVPYILFDTVVNIYINQRRCALCTLNTLKSVAYVRGTVVIEELLADSAPSLTIVGTTSLQKAGQLFSEQKVDAVIFTAYDIAPDKLTHFSYSNTELITLPDYHLLHSKHDALRLPLATMLFTLEQEGFAERLRQQFNVAAPRKQLSNPHSALIKQYQPLR